ncbi:MAG: PAS domain S-box protein [bacterium]|nr:PAS domain S-box protein [bacterium]
MSRAGGARKPAGRSAPARGGPDALLREAVNRSPAVFARWRAGDEWRIEFVSENVAQFGCSAAELVSGRVAWRDLTHPEDVPRLRDELGRRLDAGDRSFIQEYRVVTKTGEVRWVEDRTTALGPPGGAVSRYESVILDVTAGKRAEENLLLFRDLLDRSNEMLSVIDMATGRFIYVSEAACRATGFSREEFLGMGVADIDPTITGPWRPDREREARRGRGVLVREGLLRRRDGAPIPVEVRSSIVRLPDGDYMVATACDVSVRRRMTDDLRREKDALRTYLAVAPVIFVVINPEGEVVLVNRKGCELLGRTEGEIVGRNWFEHFIPSGEREEVRRVFDMVIRGDIPFLERHENAVIAAGGRERLIEWHNTVLRDGTGRIVGSLSAGLDVTEQRRLEERLRQAQKMEAIGTLAGGVAHDFNNILASIIGYATILKKGLAGQARAIEDLGRIEALSWRASGLIKALLAFARGGQCVPEPVDGNALVGEVAALVGEGAGPRITVRTDLEPGLPPVRCDRNGIRQVLLNLCSNACEAMPGGGTLAVRTAVVRTDDGFFGAHPDMRRGSYVAVSVSDTGRGIRPEHRDRILDPYFTTKDDRTGAGLGLSVSFGIVEQNGGCIEFESGEEGESRFTVFLPAAETA